MIYSEPKMIALVDFILNKFPNQDPEFVEHLTENIDNIKNWFHFVTFMEWWIKRTDFTMNIYKSSNFAITQEFLRKLSGDELTYANSRAGSWYSKYTIQEMIDQAISQEEYQKGLVSFRQLIEMLREKYPIRI